MKIDATMWASDLVVAPATTAMRRWILQRDFLVHIRIGVKVQSVTVPKGFITDFASVPRALQWLIPPMGRYGAAAVVHDYLCVTNHVSRKEADVIFLHLMRQEGVKPWKAYLMYAAVRAYARTVEGLHYLERIFRPTTPQS